MFMLRNLSLTLAAIALATTGCATAPGTTPAGQQDAEKSAKQSFPFGGTFHGMVDTTVSQPRPVDLSPSAFPKTRDAWAVDVTFHNNAPQTLLPHIFQLGATTDGRASPDVLDTQTGFMGMNVAPPIAPGETVTLPLAFSGAGSRHQVTVSSADGSETVVFR